MSNFIDHQKQEAKDAVPQKSFMSKVLPYLVPLGIILAIVSIAYFVVWPSIQLDLARQRAAINQLNQGNYGAGLALEAPEILDAAGQMFRG
jgi:hypothetical protein